MASLTSGLRERSIAPIRTWSSAGGIKPTVRLERPASMMASHSRKEIGSSAKANSMFSSNASISSQTV
jgi:hypothetical protein